jgi:non-specific serine/threonine protein kinase
MATSREALGVPGEVDYPVPPLAEAETLFVARAREVRPTLREDDATTEAVARICRDLDGLPLAIELAAARAKALSLDEIAARLADRFRFLVSWRRLTAARHRTLREAMDWSYELLGEEEQMLLARLSVFAGGFTLGAASTVCLGGADAADLIGRLVDASLAVPDEHEGEMRYRLLETVRQYAAERLDDHRETEEIRRRHVDWCVALAEQAAPELTGERQAHWFALLDAEHDNVRAALAYLMASDDRERLLLLVLPLTRFWYVRGHVGEGRRWLGHALALGAGAEIERHRRALTAAASFALLQADYPAATELAEQALEVARRGRDERYVANALSNLGAIVLAAGDGRRAADVLEDAVALARRVGDERIAALAINNLGDVALTVGDYGRAEPLFEESLALLRARGDTANVARALFNLAAVALRLGRLDTARDRLADAVSLAREAGDKEDLAWCLEGFAGLAAAEGDGERSGLLLGAAAALLDEMGAGFKPFERKLHDATEAQARVLCGQEAFADAKRRGSQLPLAEALEHAVAEPT